MKLIVLTAALTLTSCAALFEKAVDAILPDESGVEVDAQIGSNENKVDTGIASLGNETNNTITVEDSQDVRVSNQDGRYHLTTEGETTVNVYETNNWLYAIFAIYIIGKPTLRWFWGRRTAALHPHEYITYTSATPKPSSSGQSTDRGQRSYRKPD